MGLPEQFSGSPVFWARLYRAGRRCFNGVQEEIKSWARTNFITKGHFFNMLQRCPGAVMTNTGIK
jgi:hypothetical protein